MLVPLENVGLQNSWFCCGGGKHSVFVVRKITKMHGTKNPGGWVIRTLHKGVFLYKDR